jgi:cytochrome b involved in lipid metabolism
MNKIISAINSMILHQDKISNVSEVKYVYYFLYKNKYIWSIQQLETDYILSYYTGNITIEELVNPHDTSFGEYNYYNYINYSANSFKVKEAIESFENLYLIIQEKVYDIDKVLDDIIDEDFLI